MDAEGEVSRLQKVDMGLHEIKNSRGDEPSAPLWFAITAPPLRMQGVGSCQSKPKRALVASCLDVPRRQQWLTL